MMDPNHFLMIVLSRFELYHIFSSAECRKRYNRENANKVRSHCCTCVCDMYASGPAELSVCVCVLGCDPAEQHTHRGDAAPHHDGCG